MQRRRSVDSRDASRPTPRSSSAARVAAMPQPSAHRTLPRLRHRRRTLGRNAATVRSRDGQIRPSPPAAVLRFLLGSETPTLASAPRLTLHTALKLSQRARRRPRPRRDRRRASTTCSCTEKTVAWVRHALRTWPSVAFIAKSEDDTYVQLRALDYELRTHLLHQPRVLYGYIRCRCCRRGRRRAAGEAVGRVRRARGPLPRVARLHRGLVQRDAEAHLFLLRRRRARPRQGDRGLLFGRYGGQARHARDHRARGQSLGLRQPRLRRAAVDARAVPDGAARRLRLRSRAAGL